MQTNRRNWLKQLGLAVAGLSIAPAKTLGAPATASYLDKPDEGLIRLSSNENPYGPSPLARIAMSENVLLSNRYNWQLSADLVAALAKKHTIPEDHILLGAGSTEILDLTVRLAAAGKGSFIMADPTFKYWADNAERAGLAKIAVPLTPDKRHDLNAMLKAIRTDTRMIYVCNPNNPTGTICDRESLVSFVNEATKQTLVLLDEAYIDFTEQESLSSLVSSNKNLIIAKTFSKIYGLAGGRIGYAIANPAAIEQLAQLQSWANGSVSVASAAGALASLKDENFVKETYSLIEKAKKYTISQLERLHIRCIPSHSNFIYFSLANYQKDFFEQLNNNHIQGTKIYEEEGKWSRITVGTMQEMEKFIKALE